MAHDLVIRNGTVVDGSGLGSYRADVGVTGDRIAEVGRISGRGHREIDADGHVVTPGFVDGHTHMDAQVFWDATGSNSCWHGVTSAVMGNCGFTLAPVRSDERALVVRNLERAEDIDPAALAAGIDWSFETFPEYLDAVDGLAKGIHFAANIGHSALRTWAMGERAFEEEADADDLALMAGQLADALRAGAIGFSTSQALAVGGSISGNAWSPPMVLSGSDTSVGQIYFVLAPSGAALPFGCRAARLRRSMPSSGPPLPGSGAIRSPSPFRGAAKSGRKPRR